MIGEGFADPHAKYDLPVPIPGFSARRGKPANRVWAVLGILLGGPIAGALAGLIWFLWIMFEPSQPPETIDGGGAGLVVVFLIGAAFSVVGAAFGLAAGLMGLGIWALVSWRRKSSHFADPKRALKRERLADPRFDL